MAAIIRMQMIYLYEHQSTPNPNMPLRDLFYVATQYEKLIDKHALYTKSKVKIPNPHFVVFYNGIDEQEEKKVLKLSELYEHKEEDPMLELKVIFLNINPGYNEELKESCRILKEYMIFVDKVRSKASNQDMTTADAVEEAVQECIKENILRDFLTANRKEAIKMSIFEYDEEKVLRLLRESEFQDGVRQGEQNAKEIFLPKMEELASENSRLTEEKDSLTEEKNMLAEKNSTLAEEKNMLAEKNSTLAEEKNMLAEKNNTLTTEIERLKSILSQHNINVS